MTRFCSLFSGSVVVDTDVTVSEEKDGEKTIRTLGVSVDSYPRVRGLLDGDEKNEFYLLLAGKEHGEGQIRYLSSAKGERKESVLREFEIDSHDLRLTIDSV